MTGYRMTRRGLMIGLLGGVALLLPSCARQLPTYRYRFTVEVNTPSGVKAGSSVIEVKNWDQGKGFPGPEAGGFRSRARGQAVAVDIAPGKILFALLRSSDGYPDYADGIAYAILRPMKPSDKMEDRIEALLRTTSVAPLPHDQYPLLVYFRDPADARTVKRVDPDDLAAAFGPGVSLKSISVQVTDDPVTSGIRKRLPTPSEKGFFNWDGRSKFKQNEVIRLSDFTQGVRE